ncbi:hypothetical protein DPMN_066090 [Dreissena polymorpha]|uniref:Uncharacterized protein n=1 Tax=Dreissena polymorpha TaxID=45954 RepID=A0A9D3YUS6_DREPO|nr:hypothetical protein DPMN_066090 [Dreissena polymorpha]
MMATQTIARSSLMTGEKRSDAPLSARRTPQSPVFIPPNEFRMKLLKRILSVDGTIDNKALQKLQKSSSDRTLQANILFENGDVGTLISFDRTHEESLKQDQDKTADDSLPLVDQRKVEKSDRLRDGVPRERPLKLPPIMLPPIYTLTSRPLIVRDYSGPPYVPPPLSEEDWEDLEDCRYLRPAKKDFKASKENKSFLLINSGTP